MDLLKDRIPNRGLTYDEMHEVVLETIREVNGRQKVIWLIPSKEIEIAEKMALRLEEARLQRLKE